MLGKGLSFTVNNVNKEDNAKRKLSFTDECDSDMSPKTSKKFKTSYSPDSQSPENDFPKLYFKSTNSYVKVVAKPGSLLSTPKIFQFCKDRSKELHTSDPFFYSLLTARSVDTDINGRFSNIMLDKIESKKTSKKDKEQRGKKMKTPEEVAEEAIIRKKKKEKKKHRKEEAQRELMKLNETNLSDENNGAIISTEKKEKKKGRKEEPERELMKLNETNLTDDNNGAIISTEKKEKKKRRKEEAQREIMKLNETNLTDNGISGSDQDKMNNVVLYRVINKNALIFHMRPTSRFSFHGELKVTIITGEVEILGYTLNPSSIKTSVDIYSPNFYTSLTVEAKPVNQSKTMEEIQSSVKDILTEEDYNKLISELKPSDCILYIEPILSTFGIVLNKYFNKQLFPKDLEDVSSANETLKTLQGIFTFNPSKKVKHIKKNPQWDKIPLNQCTVLCGGKGVGKSTLLKYYINKFVSLGEKVLCLDLDPGQPEFSFPGCLSAVVIDQPLLGPNFSHILDPLVMTSFGDVDVTQNPTKYLDCVKYVIESCQKNSELLKIKWFVNTMGFCKGLGINLMITILKILNPDCVIQIKCSDYKNNYPFFLTSSAVNSRNGYRSMPLNNVSLSYDLRTIYSFAEREKKRVQGGLKSRELRDIMSISYFSQMVSPPFYNFNAVQPYLISFSKLYLGIDFVIDPNDVPKAFNGNMVALSHFEHDTEEIFTVHSEKEDYFKVVIKPNISPCYGIGFVRGIDCKEKKFYLITHLPFETLNNVNCLSLVRVSPPHSLFLRQDTVEREAVYTTQGAFDVFQKVKRIFRAPGTPHTTEKASA